MSEPSKFMEEVLDILKNSEEEKLEGLFHGVNLPPDWFEMVAPEFTGLFGAELNGAVVDIGELEGYMEQVPRDIKDNLKYALRIDYVIPDSDENESGTLTLPVYFVNGSYKILLVG